jgi:hypothetical protein
MNCQEFDDRWNDLLDIETAGRHTQRTGATGDHNDPSPDDLAVRGHAQACARCRPIHDRYERLRQALRARDTGFRPIPVPTPDLTRRILAASCSPPRRRFWRTALPIAAGAIAASVLLALAIAAMPWSLRRLATDRRNQIASRPQRSVSAPPLEHRSRGRDLTEALAEATEATWDLAWTTSGPAARLGRQVLVAATSTDDDANSGSTGTSDPRLGLGALAPVFRVVSDSAPGSELIQKVGDGLSASVRPLSSSARQAFGFLRTPMLGKPDNPISVRASKGA